MNGFAQELVKVCIQALLSLTAQGMDRYSHYDYPGSRERMIFMLRGPCERM